MATIVCLPAPVEWNPTEAQAVVREWIRLLGGFQQTLSPERVVFCQGDVPQDIFLLSRGLVALKCNVADGREAIVTVRFPGQMLDCCCHELDVPYFASAHVVAESTVIRLSVAELRLQTVHNPDARALVDRLAHIDVYNAATSVVALKTASPACRFERFLRHFAAATGQASDLESTGIVMPLRDPQLAEIIGLSLRHFGRIKRELQVAGCMSVRGANRFVLRRPQHGTCTAYGESEGDACTLTGWKRDDERRSRLNMRRD